MSAPSVAPPTSEELRRLSLVRHLYDLGVAQSRGSAPTAGFSILSFHDAAEAFLQLACERYDAGENKADFMQYWNLLDKKGFQVQQRESMRRINAARRGLKHQGILPDQSQLEGFRAAVTNFLYDNTQILFGIDFSKVTLVHLISDDETRKTLDEAYRALESHEHQTALGSAAVAFILMQRAYYRNQAATLPPYAYASLRALAATRSAFTSFAISDLEREIGDGVGRAVRSIVENNRDSLDIVCEGIELVSRGLDLKDYLLFKSYTPIVHQSIDGSMNIEWMKKPTEDVDIIHRCLNFVVMSAVKFGV